MLQGVEMGRKHRGKPPNKVHERIAALPVNAVVARAVVDDPYEPGTQITVLRSLRDDPLARLLARKQIAQHQYEAGRAWQRDYEASEIGSVKAIDPTVEAVDGRRFVDPFSDKQRGAMLRLEEDRAMLGELAASVVRDVLGRRLMIHQVVAARGLTGKHDLEFYGRVFREALNVIAEARGLLLVRA
jgi:hypothetical protein